MFIPRTQAQIRDGILASFQSRLQASTGKNVDVRPGSVFYNLADAFAVEQCGIQAQAQALTKQILPDKADTENLARHGAVQGVAREPPSNAVLSVRVTGSPNTTVVIGSTSMVSASGRRFTPNVTSFVTDGAGDAEVLFTCDTTGTTGNLTTGTVLSWSAAPTGVNPTGVVLSIETAGGNIESESAWASRIISRMRERPATFNRADVVALIEDFAGVEQAYVYPLLQPGTDRVGIPGTLQVVVVGPVATNLETGVQNGDSPTNTRFIGTPGELQTDIKAYFEGTVDNEGVTVPRASQKQLRPPTILEADYSIRSAARLPQHVEMTAVVTAQNACQWSGTMSAVAGTNNDTHFTVSGDHRDRVGLRMLVELSTSDYRGARIMVTPSSGTLDMSGNTVFVVATSMGGTPIFPGDVYPAPANWNAIRLAIFALFDRLTPGDAAAPSERWPGDDEAGPSTLYLGELIAAVCSVPGVVNATVVAPVADVVAPLRTIIDLTLLTFTTN